MEGKTALVTGAAGFIGSYLVEDLIMRGMRVIGVDNFISGRKENLKGFIDSDCFSFIEADVIKGFEVSQDVDFIYHLASPASPVDYYKYPEETMLVNSVGTYNMLRMAKEKRAKFLFSSTSEVYGDPLEHPQKETYWGNVNCVGERSCYDESKRYGETATMVFLKKYDCDVRIIRIFNTYGPRMRKNDGRVVSNFINQALCGEPITLYGDGVQTRSFCYVLDMVRGIYLAMVEKNTKGEVINLGNPDERTIKEFAKMIKEMVGGDSKIIYEKLPKDDPVKRKPDIEKARKLLGWSPKVELEEGLGKTIDYYRKMGSEK